MSPESDRFQNAQEARRSKEIFDLAVVIIGLNAAKTLENCLISVRRSCEPLGPVRTIYVDGGSWDESVSIAERLGVVTIRLSTDKPTAAKGRNAGWRSISTPFVQFVDSDTELEPSWLAKGLEAIHRDPAIAVVFGQLVESNPTGSIYNRLCGFDWYIPPGDWRMCGGNALFRRNTLLEVNGFDENLMAGEEPDLCWRLRHSGYRIVCIDTLMAQHDLRMTSFSSYWRRAVRSGHAYAEIGMRYARTDDRLWFREFLINLLMLPGLLVAILGAFLLGGLLAIAVLGVAALGLIFWKWFSLRKRVEGPGFRLLYAVHLYFTKIPLFVGTARHLLRRWIGRLRRYRGSSCGNC